MLQRYDLETIEMMRKIWGDEAVAQWCEMTAFKYRMRMGHKDDIQKDMEKGKWYFASPKGITTGNSGMGLDIDDMTEGGTI